MIKNQTSKTSTSTNQNTRLKRANNPAPDPIMLAVQGASELAVQTFLANFKATRRLKRMEMACLMAARGQKSFPEAYRAALIQEKEQLADLLKSQLQDLRRLRTPARILADAEDKLQTVERALKRIRIRPAERMAAEMMRDCEESTGNDAVNLSTCFVNELVVYNFLTKGRGQSVAKRLLAE